MIIRAAVKIVSFVCLFMLLGGVSACTQVRKAEYAQSVDYSDDEQSTPIHFRSLRSALPIGSEIGTLKLGYSFVYSKAGRDLLQGLNQASLGDMFAETLELQGYDVVSRLNVVFEEEYEAELSRSQYVISGKIIDADIDLSTVGSVQVFSWLASAPSGERGKLYLKIEWAVYDSLRRKTVYKTVTDGYVHRRVANLEGLTLMINDAFGMAAHNLGTDVHFHDLVFYGTKPPQDWKKKKHKEPPRLYDRNEAVEINNPPLSKNLLPEHVERSRKVAVLIRRGSAHGSGFFITKQGHILTNQHVVGEATRVRIVTADREEVLIGEVLRRDAVRDVALIKIEDMPKDLDIVTVPIQTVWPEVSADIYALGAPLHPKLMDTLTKGIVSTHRKNMRDKGARLDFIQGDVSIHGGNSGGPLMDAYGNIIGISVAGYQPLGGGANASLNLFIPIENALKAMDITLSAE
ncbi:MAG: S1C family serine protease [Alphaproteobacteria bacterium]